MTSGAAAVLTKRQRLHRDTDACRPCAETSTTDMHEVAHASHQKHANQSESNMMATDACTDDSESARRRWTDTLLVFTETARERLETRVGGWHWVKPAEGVG